VKAKIDRMIKKKFLKETKRRKEQEYDKIQKELKIVAKDIQELSDDNIVPEMYVQMSLQLDRHFDDLQQKYFDLSNNSQPAVSMTDSKATSSTNSVNSVGSCDPIIDEFDKILNSVTRYSSFKELATLHYADGPVGANRIVSSIEFDKDGDLFAVGGETNKIKIFSFASVTSNQLKFTPIHYPVRELSCNAKISSVAYNPYTKSQLATVDYYG
jgi:E3 ubiquitin-protein ligase RFWD2